MLCVHYIRAAGAICTETQRGVLAPVAVILWLVTLQGEHKERGKQHRKRFVHGTDEHHREPSQHKKARGESYVCYPDVETKKTSRKSRVESRQRDSQDLNLTTIL
jgi:hypothetical protein